MPTKNETKISKVLIAKSDKLLNDLLCEFVKGKGLPIIGSVDNGTEALKLLIEKSPDILIAGAELPGLNGIDLTVWILEKKHPTQTILFSRNKSQVLIEIAIQFKVNGFLFFDDGTDELSSCINAVLSGKSYVSPQVQEVLDNIIVKDKTVTEGPMQKGITPTELRVLWYVSLHMSIKQIAEKMFISPHTVNNHLSNIRQKLNLKGRGVVLKYALSIRNKYLFEDTW